MKCPNCNKRIADDCDFCTYCGHKIERERVCPNCHTPNDLNASFCKKCGTKLVDNKVNETPKEEKPVEEPKPKVSKNVNIDRILKIGSSSLIIFSILMILIMMFTPFLASDFYPNSDFTLLSWSINVLKLGTKDLFHSYMYVEFINSIVLLILLATILVIGGIFLAKSILRLIRTIKENNYIDSSKYLTELYVLFSGIYVYFVNIVMNPERPYADGIGGGVLFILIFIPMILCFNLFVKYRLEDKVELSTTIMRIVSRAIIFIIIWIALANIGGDRYLLSVGFNHHGKSNYALGNIDVIDFFLRSAPVLLDTSLEYLTPALIFSGVAAFFELVILVLFLRVIVDLGTTGINKRGKYKLGIILSIAIFICSIIVIISNTVCLAYLEKLNSVSKYGVDITGSLMNLGMVITYSILSIVMLAHFIVISCIDKNRVVEEVHNEEGE